MADMRSSFAGIPVGQAMVRNFDTLAPQDQLATAVDKILAGTQQDFPVVVDGRVVGILMRNDLFSALAKSGAQIPVREVMRTDFESVDPSEMLELAFRRLQNCACHTLPVVYRGNLAGLLTMENVGEFVAIQTAIDLAASRAR
jgi:predicted transcriptional regulator